MDIDLNTPNAERTALPAMTAPIRSRHRQRSPLLIAQKTRPIRAMDRASITFGLVPEARQTYPAEDDCTIVAVTRDNRS